MKNLLKVILFIILLSGTVWASSMYSDLNMREHNILNVSNINSTYFNGLWNGSIDYFTKENVLNFNYYNSTNFPYTHLSNFTDDLGDRGYSSLSNFSNDLHFMNWSEAMNGTLFLSSEYNASGLILDWNSTGFIKNWSYLTSEIDLSDYFTKSDILDFDYYNSTNLNLSMYVPYVGADKNINFGANDFTVNTNTLFVDSLTGRVGVGTTNPTYKLDVEGTDVSDMIQTDIGLDINKVVPPSSVSGSVQSGSGLGVGAYYYRVSYVTDLGESNPVLSSVITTTSGNQQVLLTLPVSSDPRVIARKIYRTKVNDYSYLMGDVTTISNNVATTYLDSTPDASLTNYGSDAYYKVDSTSKYITVNGVQAITLDAQRTSLGVSAGKNNAGGENTYVGYGAGQYSSSGSRQTFVGNQAGKNNVGTNAIAIGVNAGCFSTGNANLLIGDYAGYKLTGSENVFLGIHSGYTGSYSITGSKNTVIGRYALGNTNADFTGSNNVFLGSYSGKNAAQYMAATNSIAIGHNTYTTKSNQVVLGNQDVSETLLRGNVGINTIHPSAPLEVVGNSVSIIFGQSDNVLYQAQLVSGSAYFGFKDGDGIDRLSILQSNGNIGINTTNPQNELNVIGDGNFTGNVYSDNFETNKIKLKDNVTESYTEMYMYNGTFIVGIY